MKKTRMKNCHNFKTSEATEKKQMQYAIWMRLNVFSTELFKWKGTQKCQILLKM